VGGLGGEAGGEATHRLNDDTKFEGEGLGGETMRRETWGKERTNQAQCYKSIPSNPLTSPQQFVSVPGFFVQRKCCE